MSITQSNYHILTQFLDDHHISHAQGWENFARSQKLPHALVINVETTRQLSEVMRHIYKLNMLTENPKERIIARAAAGGNKDIENSESYSFTPCIDADVVIRLTGDEFQQIKKTAEDNIISAGASVQIGTLDEVLYKKHDLSLPTSSLIPYVTVAGLAVGGHGTGKDQPAFSGLIKSMEICLENGEIVTLDENHPDFETIRAAHHGVFGVITKMNIQCMEAKKIASVKEVRSIPELKAEMKDKLFLNDPYVSVMYVPTYQEDELTNKDNNNVIVHRWRLVTKTDSNVNHFPQTAEVIQDLQIKLESEFGISGLLRQCKEIVPYYMKYVVSKAEVGSRDSYSVGPFPEIAHYRTAYPRNIDDADYLFQVSPDCHEMIEALDFVVNKLQEYAKKGLFPVTNAIYLRFFKGTNGGLSPSSHEEGQYVCGFDIVSTPGVPGNKEFREEIRQFFINKLKAKPHWGKEVDLNFDFEEIYGDGYQDFLKAQQNWYKQYKMDLDKSMLMNPFYSKILKHPYPSKVEQPEARTLKEIECAKVIAKKFIEALKKDESQCAQLLKTHLDKIAAEKVSESKNSIFNKPKIGDCGEQQNKKSKKSWCVVI